MFNRVSVGRINRPIALAGLCLVALATTGSACVGVLEFAYGDVAADFPRYAATNQAAVTATSVNGFGGDPIVQYRFAVGGVTYHGSGPDGKLGNPPVNRLSPGDTVTVRYSSINPRHSRSCDPSTLDTTMEPDWSFRAQRLLYFAPLLAILLGGLLAALSVRSRSW